MSSVLLCYTITKQLKEALEKVNDENRETTIEKVESLLEKRQSVLGTIKPPYTQDEQELGQADGCLESANRSTFSSITFRNQTGHERLNQEKNVRPKILKPIRILTIRWNVLR